MENLWELTTDAFDKTGTLSKGDPTLTEVVPFGNTITEKLLTVAVAVEKLSDHPIAAAVVAGGKKDSVKDIFLFRKRVEENTP